MPSSTVLFTAAEYAALLDSVVGCPYVLGEPQPYNDPSSWPRTASTLSCGTTTTPPAAPTPADSQEGVIEACPTSSC